MNKLLIFLIISLFPSLLWTREFEIPKCDSSEARLSRTRFLCEGVSPSQFDIPALKLQFSDLQKIVQGAESSGGRRRPDILYRPGQTVGMQSPTHSCEARLLIDGGLRVSWLLTLAKEIGAGSVYQIAASEWSSGLVAGNDINADQIPTTQRPDGELVKASFVLDPDLQELNLCLDDKACSSGFQNAQGEYVSQIKLRKGVTDLIFKMNCYKL